MGSPGRRGEIGEEEGARILATAQTLNAPTFSPRETSGQELH